MFFSFFHIYVFFFHVCFSIYVFFFFFHVLFIVFFFSCFFTLFFFLPFFFFFTLVYVLFFVFCSYPKVAKYPWWTDDFKTVVTRHKALGHSVAVALGIFKFFVPNEIAKNL